MAYIISIVGYMYDDDSTLLVMITSELVDSCWCSRIGCFLHLYCPCSPI